MPTLDRQHRKANGNASHSRRGAVAVEVALTLPLLLLFVFGAIEFSRLNMLRHTAENASYEGARRGALPGASKQEVQQAASDVLDLLNVQKYTVSVSPNNITHSTKDVTVTVTIPVANNAWIAPMFASGMVITKEITLARERSTGT
ncbi:MAG: pilus assembly protein [Planctomycetales bacterium]|nr:pilus assembly protein [Planctomycetales bacterium]